MPYTSPQPYPAIVKTYAKKLTPTKTRYVFHLTGPVAAIGADRLLARFRSMSLRYRLELSEFFVLGNMAAPPTAELKFKHYNDGGSNEFGLYELATGTLFLQFGPPKFSIPIYYGDNLDLLFDGDTLTGGVNDKLYLSFVAEEIYEGVQ